MSTSSNPNLVKSLINASEKASNIARICRANEKLLSLLVQEKTGNEANTRFDHDFKTLADVLIQESIRHDIGVLFPELRDNIKGEESPSFTNTLGESVLLCITDDETNTKSILRSILHGDEVAAEVLTKEVHCNVSYLEDQLANVPQLPDDIDYSDLAIWIDPIDATAEYINGDSIFTNFPGITSTGLDCVTVLIGVYQISTGVPIIGVISQPFYNKISNNIYKSHIFWGISIESTLIASNCEDLPTSINREHLLGIFSSSEKPDVLQHCMSLGYEFAFSAGAGHKALKVITSEVDLYLLSKGSTFKWDTCAPQAILRALGGDIYDYKESLQEQKPIPLSYKGLTDSEIINSTDLNCNKGGLIAVRDRKLIVDLIQKFAAK